MLAVCFRDIESVASDSIPDAAIESTGDAVVQVELAGLCGSDLHPFFGRERGLQPGTVMGHEFVGRIIEVGPEVQSFAVGDRVCSPFTTNCGQCFYCRNGLSARCDQGQLFGWRSNDAGLHGGQSELVRVPMADGTLMKLPEQMSTTEGLLLGDNLTTGYYAASMAIDQGSLDSDVLAVVGCGTVGLLAIAAATRLGAKQIFAVDPNHARLEIAKRLGASVCDNPHEIETLIRQATDGRGADGVMELVGLPDAQSLAYRLVRPGGRMSVIGCHCTPNFAFSPADAYDKNLTYRTGRCPARSLMDEVADLHASHAFDLSWAVTHRFGVHDAVEAYDVFANRKRGCIKAVLEF